MKPNPFPQLLSYRDSWRLFLRFVVVQKTKSVAKLGMDDLTAAEVLAFLKDVEHVRKSSIGTGNCRLAALHSFFNPHVSQAFRTGLKRRARTGFPRAVVGRRF
jgi:hypothetical protein